MACGGIPGFVGSGWGIKRGSIPSEGIGGTVPLGITIVGAGCPEVQGSQHSGAISPRPVKMGPSYPSPLTIGTDPGSTKPVATCSGQHGSGQQASRDRNRQPRRLNNGRRHGDMHPVDPINVTVSTNNKIRLRSMIVTSIPNGTTQKSLREAPSEGRASRRAGSSVPQLR